MDKTTKFLLYGIVIAGIIGMTGIALLIASVVSK